MLDGIAEACDDPRRCVTYANIFEVKPGMLWPVHDKLLYIL